MKNNSPLPRDRHSEEFLDAIQNAISRQIGGFDNCITFIKTIAQGVLLVGFNSEGHPELPAIIHSDDSSCFLPMVWSEGQVRESVADIAWYDFENNCVPVMHNGIPAHECYRDTPSDKDRTTVHDIVTSASFPFSEIAGEFMVRVRGYLKRTDKDLALFAKAEETARQACEDILAEKPFRVLVFLGSKFETVPPKPDCLLSHLQGFGHPDEYAVKLFSFDTRIEKAAFLQGLKMDAYAIDSQFVCNEDDITNISRLMQKYGLPTENVSFV